MATKVNRDYWSGTIYNMSGFPNADDVGYLDGQLADLISNDSWDIANNDEFDLSVCPWGLPQCSLSSLATPVFAKDEGNKVILSFQESNRRNMPFFINRHTGRVKTDEYNTAAARTDNKQRIVGDTAKSTSASYNLRYTNTIDTKNLSSNYISSNTKPIVKLQYSAVRAWLGSIWYFDTLKYDNFSNVGFTTADYTDFLNLKNIDATKWRYKVVRSGLAISSKLNSDTRINLHCCGKSNIPEYLQEQYYNEGTTEYIDLSREIRIIGQNVGNYPGYGNYGYTYFDDPSKYGNTLPTLKTTKSNDYGCSANSTCICNVSAKRQKFSDVSYHWEQHLYYYTTGTSGTGVRLELKNGEVLPFNTAKYVNPIITLEIDETIYDNYYDSALAALMHEAAFLGFPFCKSFNDINNDLSDTTCFIPVFDYEHMITTGEYKRGDEASDLPNFTWGDIFDTSVPAYDPNYIPPEPEHDEHDRGDLYNRGARRFFWNSLKVHLLSAANYDQFVQKLNSLNMSDPDNETWQLQFKGLNPSDYIVGAYASFVKPPKSTATTIKLGPVDLEQSEYTYKESDTNAGFFTFGTRTINPEFNDFRDFAPYTMIELYLPLCGTIELDTAYFMGASVKIDYYYDIYTMSCTACIYRVKDNQELLYKTVNGTIGAQIPMLSGNMGAYQNQIKSIENAMKQNEMKVLTSTAVLAAGIVAAPMTSGTSLIAAGTATLSGAAGIASGLQKQAELDYQIEHIQPSMSVTGAADPQTDICTGQLMPKLIIKRAEMLNTYNQAEYAKTIGHACCINDILGYIEGDTESPRSGLVVCSSVDTSGIIQMISESDYIAPTADEVNMIKQALSSGVIL